MIIQLLLLALQVYFWIVIMTVVVSWLVVFDAINTRNKWVFKFCDFLNKATNPVIMRLRKVVPPMGGIDITPMIVIFGIYFLENMLHRLAYSLG
jgi:YggT family protein